MEKYRNVLLNVLNVLKRISDENFIREYWGKGKNYNSIIISCVDALEILDDYFFYDLLLENKGEWKNIVAGLSIEVKKSLILLAKKTNAFDGCEKKIEHLLIDENWRNIMNLSRRIADKLERELNIEDDLSYLI